MINGAFHTNLRWSELKSLPVLVVDDDVVAVVEVVLVASVRFFLNSSRLANSFSNASYSMNATQNQRKQAVCQARVSLVPAALSCSLRQASCALRPAQPFSRQQQQQKKTSPFALNKKRRRTPNEQNFERCSLRTCALRKALSCVSIAFVHSLC